VLLASAIIVLALLCAYVVRRIARNVPPRRRKHSWGQVEQAVDNEFGIFDGTYPEDVIRREGVPKVGRNDPCPCGSGKKYKRCCGQ
jgi:uncharacterized protein YecA (UPF0149 family)